MSEIKLLVGAELDSKAISEIERQIKGIEKGLDKIKIDVDTSSLKDATKHIEKITKDLKSLDSANLEVLSTKGLKDFGLEFKKIEKSTHKAMKDIEKSYSQIWKTEITGAKENPLTKEIEQFTLKVDDAEGRVQKLNYTLKQLDTGERVFVNTGITNMDKSIQQSVKSSEQLLNVQKQLINTGRQLDNLENRAIKNLPEGSFIQQGLLEEIERVREAQRGMLDDLSRADTSSIREMQVEYAKVNEQLNKYTKEFQRVEQAEKRFIDDSMKLTRTENKLDNMEKNLSTIDQTSTKYGELKMRLEALKEVHREYNEELQRTGQIEPNKQKRLDQNIASLETELKREQEAMRAYQEEQKKLAQAEEEAFKKQQLRYDGYTQMGSGLQQFGRVLTTVTAPILGLGAASIKAYSDYESAFAGVKKTTTATQEEFAKLDEGFRELSMSLPQSASEIANVGEIAGQLGIHKDAMLDFTEVMIMMGDTTTMSSAEAAENMARFANIVGMSQEDFDRLGSTLLDLGNNLATSEKEILDMSLRMGGAGRQVGMLEHEILALAGAMSSAGIKAQAGGSAMSKLLTNMQVASEKGVEMNSVLAKTGMTLRDLEMIKSHDSEAFSGIAMSLNMTKKELSDMIDAKKDLDNFGKAAGMTGEQFAKAFGQDAVKGLQAFIEGLGEVEDNGGSVISVLDEMGINEIRLRDAILRTVAVRDILNDSLDIGNKAWEENNELQSKASERYETAEAQMAMTRNRIAEVARELGQNLLPIVLNVLEVVERFVSSFSGMSGGVQRFIFTLAGIGMILGLLTTTVGRSFEAFGRLGKAVLNLGQISKETSGTVSLVGGALSKTEGETQGLITTLAELAKNPLLWKAGAIALGVGAIGLAIKKVKDETEEANRVRDEFIDKYSEKVQSDKQIINDTKELKYEFESLNALVGENGDLSAMTAEQKERYLQIVQQLSEHYPEMETFYNAQGELVADTTTKIEELINAKKEEMRIDREKAAEATMEKYDKEIKALDKQKQKLEDLQAMRETFAYHAEHGKTTDGYKLNDREIKQAREQVEHLDKEIDKINGKISETQEGLLQALEVNIEAFVSGLNNIDLENTNFAKSFERFIDEGLSEEEIRQKIVPLKEVLLDIDDRIENNLSFTNSHIREYVNNLSDAGFALDEINEAVIKTVASYESSEEKIQAANKAQKEYAETGKLNKETLKELGENFGGITEDIQKFDKDMIAAIAKTDEWLAVSLALQQEVKSGLAELFNEFTEDRLAKIKPEEFINPEGLASELEEARRVVDGHLKDLETSTQEQKDIITYLYKDLGLLTHEQYAEAIDKLNKSEQKQQESIEKAFEGYQMRLAEMGNTTRTEILQLSQDVEDGVISVEKAWDKLSPETKEFVAEQIGVDDVSEVTDELLKKWAEKPETKKFIAMAVGLAEISYDVENLQAIWESLTPEEKRFIAKEVGFKDVEKATDEVMEKWADDPKIKEFLMYIIGHDKVIESKKNTDEVWSVEPEDKIYKSKEEGADNVISKAHAALREFFKGGENPTKTFTQTIRTVFQGGTAARNWRGNKNFEGGLSYVGEKGKELIVYPDGTYDLTGDRAELRMLPAGTRIYNNPDTKKILEEDKKRQQVYAFAKGNAKPKRSKRKTTKTPKVEEPRFLLNTDAIIRAIQIQNDHLEKRVEILNRELEIAKRIEDVRRIGAEHNVYEQQMENNLRLIESYKREQEEVHRKAEEIREKFKKWDTESWFDANGEQTVAYINQYNKATREQQKQMERVFQKLQKYKQGWYEANSAINSHINLTGQLQYTMDANIAKLQDFMAEIISLERDIAKADLQIRRQNTQVAFDNQRASLDAEIQGYQDKIDGIRNELDTLDREREARQRAEAAANYQERINEMYEKIDEIKNRKIEEPVKEEVPYVDVSKLNEEKAKQLGYEEQYNRYLEHRRNQEKDLLRLSKLQQKLANIRKNKNIQELVLKDDGTWEFQYVADQREITRVQDDIADLNDSIAENNARYQRQVQKHYDDLKKKQEKAYEDQLKKHNEMQDKKADDLEKAQDELAKLIDDYHRWQQQIQEEDYRRSREREIEEYQRQIDRLNEQYQTSYDTTMAYYDAEEENIDRHYHDIQKMAEKRLAELRVQYDDDWEKITLVMFAYFEEIKEEYGDLLDKLNQPLDLEAMFPEIPKNYIEGAKREREKDYEYYFGNEGGTIEQQKRNNQRLKHDKAFRDAEVERAERVIKYREAAGLDTTAQEKYLKSIKKIRYAKGGITERTGLHWLDGKPNRPERVLSPKQNQLFESLVNDLPNLNLALSQLTGVTTTPTVVKTPVVPNEKLSYSTSTNNNIEIKRIEFPNVKDAKEIERAIRNLPNHVDQYKFKK